MTDRPAGRVYGLPSPCRVKVTASRVRFSIWHRTFTIAGQCGVPTTARSVAINLTVTQSNAGGDLRLYSAGGATPPSSSINYKTGQTRANNTRILLGAGGALAVHSDQASGSVQVIIDVNGYFQ